MSAITESHSSRARLLIIDDRPENLYSFRQILEPDGYELDLASSAQEAFRFLLAHQYACVLCDVQMPDMDGFEVIATLRSDPEHSETPVVFVTAHTATGQRMLQAFDLGALDFVTKPVEPAILRAKVRVFTTLQQQRLALLRQRDLFESTMGSLQEGVAVVESDGRVSYLNQAMKDLLQEPVSTENAASRLTTVPLYTLDTRDLLSDASNPFHRAMRSETLEDQEVYVPGNLDAGGQYWSVSVVRVRAERLTKPPVAIVVRNVTASRLAMLNIEQQNRDLEHYAYAASHDLKAPLRHISSFGSILSNELRGFDSSTANRALSFILGATEDMRALVDGLLALSTMGRQALKREEISLRQLFTRLWNSERIGGLPDGASLLVEPPDSTVWADADAIGQVAVNLFSNAIKFRREDVNLCVQIQVDALPTHDRITVRDNGIGIPSEQFERVFQMFQRLHSKTSYEGHGIGLALCRKIVELHGGEIYLRKTESPGATFVIELPRVRPQT